MPSEKLEVKLRGGTQRYGRCGVDVILPRARARARGYRTPETGESEWRACSCARMRTWMLRVCAKLEFECDKHRECGRRRMTFQLEVGLGMVSLLK